MIVRIYAFHLSIGPRMADLGEPMFNTMRLANPVKGNIPIRFRFLAFCKLNAVIGQDRVNAVRHGRHQIAEKVFRDYPCGLGMKFCVGKLRRPINRHKQIQPTLIGLNFGNIDMEVANDYVVSFDALPLSYGRFHAIVVPVVSG